MANPLFTIGHSVRPIGVFIDLLKADDVRHESPLVRGYSQRAGKSLFARDCVVGLRGLELPIKPLSAASPLAEISWVRLPRSGGTAIDICQLASGH
jgi:hypothetical protein